MPERRIGNILGKVARIETESRDSARVRFNIEEDERHSRFRG